MKQAYNVRSEKAYYSLLRQLDGMEYRTPARNLPSDMHRWHVYGRNTVLFIETDCKYVTYQSVDYAEDQGYTITVFKPKDIFKEKVCL